MQGEQQYDAAGDPVYDLPPGHVSGTEAYRQNQARAAAEAAQPPVGTVVVLLSALVVGWAGGFTYLGGMLLAYLLYSYSHWASHALPPKTAYGRWMRRHHFYHHFENPQPSNRCKQASKQASKQAGN